jgi:hypothetical protein
VTRSDVAGADADRRLLIRPQPCEGESWGGYLRRLAAKNGYRGIGDLGVLVGLSTFDLLKADPSTVLPGMGIQWRTSTGSQAGRMVPTRRARSPKLPDAGRSMAFRFCPLCLAEDAEPHIRAEWDGPVTLACRHHEIVLVTTCHSCGRAPSYQQRFHEKAGTGAMLRSPATQPHLTCECGEPYASHPTQKAPEFLSQFAMLFPEAFKQVRKDTFAGSTVREREVSAIAHWLAEDLDPTTGRRKKKMNCKFRVLDLQTLGKLAAFLSEWPRHAVTLVRMEYDESAAQPTWFLKRRLWVNKYRNMQQLVRALEETTVVERQVWQQENGAMLLNPKRKAYGLRDLQRVTGLGYLQLIQFCASGRIPETRQGSVKVGRYNGVEVPAHIFRAISRAYRDTDSSDIAALHLGCSEHAIRGLIKSGCLRSFSLTPTLVYRRTCPRERAKMAQYLFRAAQASPHVPERDRVCFSHWVPGPYSHATAKRWLKVLTAVHGHRVTLHSSVEQPVRLDELFITSRDLKRVFSSRER